MKLYDYGYCTYHNQPVPESLCRRKGDRCLRCDYLISKEKYVTVEEASKIVGKSQATVRNWIKKGKLRAINYDFKEKYGRKTYQYNVYFIERESLNKI